ncbi:hypothetical protein CI102_7081 [Trichoderma harzianum]|nr:hypothetical protein CI102_7081 [Trichoderma harzianum]
MGRWAFAPVFKLERDLHVASGTRAEPRSFAASDKAPDKGQVPKRHRGEDEPGSTRNKSPASRKRERTNNLHGPTPAFGEPSAAPPLRRSARALPSHTEERRGEYFGDQAMQYREVVHWQLRSLNRPASSLGPSPDAAKPHERPNEYSRTNRDAQAGARPEAQWQCNGNGIDNSPPLSPLVAHESMCLLACTATVRADITPAGMWPSHKQDLSPAPAADWGCV